MKLSVGTASATCLLAGSLAQAFVIPALFEDAFASFRSTEGAAKLEGALEQYVESLNEATEGSNLQPEDFPKPHIPYFLKPLVETEKLQGKIDVDDLNATAIELFHLANSSVEEYGHPTRVIGSKGHWNTIKYILDQFDQMKDYYTTRTQNFTALSGKISSFNLSDALTGETFANTTAFSLSPPVKEFIGEVVEIPNLGCNPEDFEAAFPGHFKSGRHGGKHHEEQEKKDDNNADVDHDEEHELGHPKKHDKKHDKKHGKKHDKKHGKKHGKKASKKGGIWPWSKHPEEKVEPFMDKDAKKHIMDSDVKKHSGDNRKHPCRKHGQKKIALIERGQCPFGDKVELAGKYGYHAVIIYDNDPSADSGLHGTLGNPTNHSVSTLGVTFETGQELSSRIAKNKHYKLKFAMDSFVKKIQTTNIIADTKHGDPENIVALGAHSDSVEEGPGINDDGSGTVSLLTVAKQLTHFKINNKVRFAWWAAEEEGLVGSNYYADHLSKKENQKIRVFMDYDMMASPNYEYEVYDANNKENPAGSEELKDLYVDFYKSKGLNYTLIPFDGRSDYVGFIENGIPAGGIAAGAEKTNVFHGGVLDKCYHQLCDNVTNLAWDAFLINTQLIAHSVATYANSFHGFPERNVNATVAANQPAGKRLPLFPYRADKLVI